MFQLKTMKHIATSRMIPGIRSIPSLGRSHHRVADIGRIQASLGHMSSQDLRRNWLNQQWNTSPTRHRAN